MLASLFAETGENGLFSPLGTHNSARGCTHSGTLHPQDAKVIFYPDLSEQVAPDLPAIDLALVQDLTSAMYWDIISGALSECAETWL